MCALALALNLWGIRRDLPYVHDYDEQSENQEVNATGVRSVRRRAVVSTRLRWRPQRDSNPCRNLERVVS